MGLVDRAGDHPVVRLGAELRVSAIRIVPDVTEQLRLARARREDERTPRDRDEHLPRALLLDLAALLERLLVEDSNHVARSLVHDDLFLAELLPRRGDAVAPAELRERHLEDAPQEVSERIADVALGRRLRPAALRAHPVRRRGIGPAVDALVAESFRDVDRRLLGVDQVAFRAREAALVRQDVVLLFDLDEGPLRILRIVDDADLLGHRREME